eukprot:12427047-Prorocentrum_lima.AAC.1
MCIRDSLSARGDGHAPAHAEPPALHQARGHGEHAREGDERAVPPAEHDRRARGGDARRGHDGTEARRESA